MKQIKTIVYIIILCIIFGCGKSNVSSPDNNLPLTNYPGLGPSIVLTHTQLPSEHKILLEKVDQDWCNTCKESNDLYIDMVDNQQLENYAIMVSYHSGQLDHFSKSTNATSNTFFNARDAEYALWGHPHVQKNGKRHPTTGEDYWNSGLTTILGTSTANYTIPTSNFGIKIDIIDHTVIITVSNYSSDPINYLTTKIFGMIVEDTHTYNELPKGSNQLRYINTALNVLDIVPLTATTLDSIQSITYNLKSYPLPAIKYGSNLEITRYPINISLVVFIQNLTTMDVYQAAKISINP